MKQRFRLILVTIIFQQFLTFGQNSPCVNDVSTDPNAPTNTSLPNDTVSGVPYDSLFLNEFNWVPFNQFLNLQDLETVGFSHLGSQQAMRPLYTPAVGISGYYQYLRDELVMPTMGVGGFIPNHENGWELLAVNLGFFPDGTPYSDLTGVSNQHPRIPYVILYHRYLSKIRVFANIGDEWALNHAYDAVRIRLGLNDGYDLNGLFRLQNGIDQSLDQATSVRSVGALAEAPNDMQRWFSADFTVAYDPCVCNYQSAINIDFELVKNTDLKLYGRGISLEEEIVDGNGTFVQDDFLSGFAVDFDNPEINQGGFIMYKKMEDLFDDYIGRMEHYDSTLAAVNKSNATVKRNLAIVKWVKHAVDVGVVAATGGSATSVALINGLLTHASGIVGSDITATKLSERWKKVFEKAEEILGKEIMTFVNNNFKNQDTPTIPEKPTANFSEMYFEGRLQQVDPKNGPTIYTPGTYGNSITNDLPDQHHYPVYNEALGVFALLKRPKINIYEGLDYKSCAPLDDSGYGAELSFHHSMQFAIADKLEYFFNPALTISEHSIDASFVFYGSETAAWSHSPFLNDDSLSVNIESVSFDNEVYRDTLPDQVIFNSTYVPLDVLNNFTGQFGQIISTKPQTLPTDDHCQIFEAWEFDMTDYQRIGIDSIYLKLLINVTYDDIKSDGSPHEYTYMFTYKIDSDDITWDYNNPLYPNLSGSVGDITQYPEDLYLSGINFDGSEIEGCKLVGSSYTCQSWSTVTVDGTFTVANGYDVHVKAGNEITVIPEAVLPPEMVLSIEPILDYSSPMPPMINDSVAAFCLDTEKYNARNGTKILTSPLDPIEETTPSSLEEQDNFSFDIYPNPTGGQTTVALTLDEQSVVDLVVTDISGKILVSGLANSPVGFGRSEYQLATETLASGIYLVHLSVNGERHVKRLIKN